MAKIILILAALIFTSSSFADEIYLNMDRNFTNNSILAFQTTGSSGIFKSESRIAINYKLQILVNLVDSNINLNIPMNVEFNGLTLMEALTLKDSIEEKGSKVFCDNTPAVLQDGATIKCNMEKIIFNK